MMFQTWWHYDVHGILEMLPVEILLFLWLLLHCLLFLVLSEFPRLDKTILPGLVFIGHFNKICLAGPPVQSCHI